MGLQREYHSHIATPLIVKLSTYLSTALKLPAVIPNPAARDRLANWEPPSHVLRRRQGEAAVGGRAREGCSEGDQEVAAELARPGGGRCRRRLCCCNWASLRPGQGPITDRREGCLLRCNGCCAEDCRKRRACEGTVCGCFCAACWRDSHVRRELLGLRSRQTIGRIIQHGREWAIHRSTGLLSRCLLCRTHDSGHSAFRAGKDHPANTRAETARTGRETEILRRYGRGAPAVQGRRHPVGLPRLSYDPRTRRTRLSSILRDLRDYQAQPDAQRRDWQAGPAKLDRSHGGWWCSWCRYVDTGLPGRHDQVTATVR